MAFNLITNMQTSSIQLSLMTYTAFPSVRAGLRDWLEHMITPNRASFIRQKKLSLDFHPLSHPQVHFSLLWLWFRVHFRFPPVDDSVSLDFYAMHCRQSLIFIWKYCNYFSYQGSMIIGFIVYHKLWALQSCESRMELRLSSGERCEQVCK